MQADFDRGQALPQQLIRSPPVPRSPFTTPMLVDCTAECVLKQFIMILQMVERTELPSSKQLNSQQLPVTMKGILSTMHTTPARDFLFHVTKL